jgi:hypothetical protein
MLEKSWSRWTIKRRSDYMNVSFFLDSMNAFNTATKTQKERRRMVNVIIWTCVVGYRCQKKTSTLVRRECNGSKRKKTNHLQSSTYEHKRVRMSTKRIYENKGARTSTSSYERARGRTIGDNEYW